MNRFLLELFNFFSFLRHFLYFQSSNMFLFYPGDVDMHFNFWDNPYYKQLGCSKAISIDIDKI